MKIVSKIGSAYGGWNVALGLIPQRSNIISCGIGNDYTFDKFLIEKRDCYVVMVDPNQVAINALAGSGLPSGSYRHIRAALWTDTGGVDFGAEMSNGAGIFSDNRKVHIGSVTIDGLLGEYPEASVLKMDIEGAEYECIARAKFTIRPAQIAVGFHTQVGNGDIESAKEKIISLGYLDCATEDEGPEITKLFIRKDLY